MKTSILVLALLLRLITTAYAEGHPHCGITVSIGDHKNPQIKKVFEEEVTQALREKGYVRSASSLNPNTYSQLIVSAKYYTDYVYDLHYTKRSLYPNSVSIEFGSAIDGKIIATGQGDRTLLGYPRLKEERFQEMGWWRNAVARSLRKIPACDSLKPRTENVADAWTRLYKKGQIWFVVKTDHPIPVQYLGETHRTIPTGALLKIVDDSWGGGSVEYTSLVFPGDSYEYYGHIHMSDFQPTPKEKP